VIRLALLVVVFMLPGIALGSLLLYLFPYISQTLLVLLSLAIIMGTLLWYIKRRRTQHLLEDADLLQKRWYHKNWPLVVTGLATALSSTFAFNNNKTHLYIDNGSKEAVTVSISHAPAVTVAAGKNMEVEVVAGKLDISYHNRSKTYDITKDGKWILNIDTQYIYIKAPVTYSTGDVLYKDGKNQQMDEEDYPIIKEEFFNTQVDYLFDAPTSITIKRKRYDMGSKEVNKMVLYHYPKDDYTIDEDDEKEAKVLVEKSNKASGK
jgi:hypothetical protein